jgi:hypothetical protein
MADAFDRAIAVVAGRQYGYVTRSQLLALGLGPGAIKHRIETGGLIRAHAGVYAVGHARKTPLARAAAAVLACGDGALLSHGSAATLWGFNKYWDLPFEVTVTSPRSRNGIKVHRSRALSRRDIDRQHGIRVTSPARTVLDITPRLSDKRVTRVVNNGRHARVLHLDDLVDVLNRNPNHPGTKRLRGFLETTTGITRSDLEDRFVAFARSYGLPEPATNVPLLGYIVDVLYPDERVIVEVDSFEFHRLKSEFEGDRDRDATMLAAGYLTVRVTDERMNQTPVREARRLNSILQSRRAA